MIAAADIAVAAHRVAPHVRRTGLFVSEPMSERTGGTIAIKCEHEQLTGSFKLRGATNVIAQLDDAQLAAGVVAASSGNHGVAVATAAATHRTHCTVFLPAGASPSKVDAIRRKGARIVTVDSTDPVDAESAARCHAADRGVAYLAPYNDPAVIAGQGTIAVEALQDAAAIGLSTIDALVVAVGGGGLISGVATWFKANSPHTKVIGASPANDQAMVASVAEGRIVTPPSSPTWSDGTAGGIDNDSITFDICRRLVDEWITVAEHDIALAVADMIDDHHTIVEGAAGVALSAACEYAGEHPDHNVVAISCGANVTAATLRAMLTDGRPG
jgi:threonine dehydratase